jgi:hypothetical protein
LIEILNLGSVSGYIDPGSLSTVMVALMGVFAGVGMVLKTYWHRIKEKLSKN